MFHVFFKYQTAHIKNLNHYHKIQHTISSIAYFKNKKEVFSEFSPVSSCLKCYRQASSASGEMWVSAPFSCTWIVFFSLQTS